MSKNISSLSARKGLKNNLFDRLIQLGSGTLNQEQALVQNKQLANEFLVGEATIKGASSFYDFIEGENAHVPAYLCDGSSCLCAGTQDILYERLVLAVGERNVGHVACLGRCHENSAFRFKGVNYSGEDIFKLDEIMDQGFKSGEVLRARSFVKSPILTEDIKDVNTYYQLLTSLIKNNRTADVFADLSLSGLRGRGGAGFPAVLKWQACAKEQSEQKYIVCNADEGDPGAFSDRYLLEQRPHHVLFGMWVAGWLVGASQGVLYIRDEYPEAINACTLAIEEFDKLNFSDHPFRFKIIGGAGAYICGEETALLRSIEGQRPVVSVRPPFPAQQGLFNKPTVVNNVETFASLHWILQNGGQAFKTLGTEKSSGTKLVSLDSSFNKPGVIEVEMGTPLADIVETYGGGLSKQLKALHIGGPLGGLVPIEKVPALTLDFESFSQQGFLLGHAGIVGIPEAVPLLSYLHHLFEFTAAESCGKCFPCRLGATRGMEMFENAIDGTQNLNRELLEDLLETMELGSLCALGGGIPLPIKNALQWFEDELAPYFEPQTENEQLGAKE